MNEVKVGKLPIYSFILAILFHNYFKGAKIWWLFAQLYRNPTECFVLEGQTVSSRFQNRVCSPHQEKKIYIYIYIANKEMGAARAGSQ